MDAAPENGRIASDSDQVKAHAFNEAFAHMAKRAPDIARDFEKLRWRWNGNPVIPDAEEILEVFRDLLGQVRSYLEEGQESISCESGYHPARLYVDAQVDMAGQIQIRFGYKKEWYD